MQLRARLKVGNGWIHSLVQPSLPLQPLHKDHHQFMNQNSIAKTKTTKRLKITIKSGARNIKAKGVGTFI